MRLYTYLIRTGCVGKGLYRVDGDLEFGIHDFDTFEDGNCFLCRLAVFPNGVFDGSDTDTVQRNEGYSSGFFFNEDF